MIKFTEKYPGESVRALSWKEPFCSLMLQDKIETRVWDARYRGFVLMCASQQPYRPSQIKDICGIQFDRVEEYQRKRKWIFPLGKAIAIGRLVSSVSVEDAIEPLIIKTPKSSEDNRKNIKVLNEWSDKCFVELRSGLWLHTYEDVQPIVPFDWKGTQGWSTLNEEQLNKIILL